MQTAEIISATELPELSQAVPWFERRRIRIAVVLLLIAQMAVGMLLSASRDTPSGDEVAHLGAGLAYLKLHDLRFDADNPPLSKLISALPFVFSRINVPSNAPEIKMLKIPERDVSNIDRLFGDRILYGAGNSANHVIWLARLPMIVVTLLLALVIFGFASELFGAMGGLISLAVATFTPALLAHGRLVNTDVTGAAFLLVTIWFLWKARERNAWLIGAAVAYGLALASKSTGLTLLPAIGLLVVLSAFQYHKPSSTRSKAIWSAEWLVAFVGIAFVVVWGMYGLIDPRLRFDRPYPRADIAHGVMASATKHLPLPAQYRVGMLSKISDEQSGRVMYFLGQSYGGGRLYFYPIMLLIKTPIAALVLWILGVIALWRLRKRSILLYLFAPAGLLFAEALISNINIGIRSIILVPIVAAISAGAIALRVFRHRSKLVGALIVLTALSVWLQYPAYLSYTSEAFGGPNHGYRLISESDLDWAGQDLGRLQTYVDQHFKGEPVWLVFFGVVRPEAYGFNTPNRVSLTNWFQLYSPAELHAGMMKKPIDFVPIHEGEVHGIVAISATVVQHPDWYPYFAELGLHGPPFAQVGHSILLWRVDPKIVA